jgi:putative two-component system response regulator
MSESTAPLKPANILIVDDTPENLDVLSGMLAETGYAIRPVTSGRAALKSMRLIRPDIILLDINMREMDGFELCEIIKRDKELSEIPVIFISSLNAATDKVKAFSVGGVDYITKPFHHEEVLARVNAHLKIHTLQNELATHNANLERLVQLKIQEIYDSQMATIFALAKLAESRDDATGRHLERVQNLCRTLSRRMAGADQFKHAINDRFIENIFNASPLHDVGKVGIADSILLKPGKLTPAEYEMMKKHAVIGAETLTLVQRKYSKNVFIDMGIDIARHHHERWDGFGYPDRLAGEAIPLAARILAVIDVYDAMRTKRCYKEARTHEDAVAEISGGRQSQFDPDVADAFLEIHAVIRDEWDTLNE